MSVIGDWFDQHESRRRLQLLISLSTSTIITGLLAIAFRGSLFAAFGLNLTMLLIFVAVAAIKGRELVSSELAIDSADPQPLVPFVQLAPLPQEAPKARKSSFMPDDEAFVQEAVAQLGKPKRSRRRSGSQLCLVPDQEELLRKASLQAKLRDRRLNRFEA